MTQQQATELEQAIKTAQKNGHRVYTATVNATGATCYTVRSHSDPNTFHILHIDGGRIRCDCSRHHHGHICSHAAAVRLFLLAQRESLKQVEARDEQERNAERLASLPRHLASVTESQEQKLEREAERAAAEQRKAEFDKHFGPGLSKSVEEIMVIEREARQAEAKRLQAERAAKREGSILETTPAFSIWKS